MHIKSETVKLPKSPEEFVGPDNARFSKALEDPTVWSTIPLLNYTPLHQLKDYAVVRFRGMIQDMLDPEIYLENYEVKNDEVTRMQQGKYRDCLLLSNGEEVNYHADANVQGERRVLFVVSIPGINEWAQCYEEECNKKNVPEMSTVLDTQEASCSKKRPAPEEEMDTESMEVEQTTNVQVELNKRQKTELLSTNGSSAESKQTSSLAAEYLLNSPIPERPGKACMVKIYKDFDSLTLNTIVDVVGFLSVDPALDATTMDVDCENASELQAHNPPPSLIPRLHAIAVHKLSHPNPLLDIRLQKPSGKEDIDNINILSVQKDLRMLLTLCLFNDDLAADYLLSHLISTVYSRCELQSIGKFSLNICNLPRESIADYTKQLYGILEQILPVSHYLPMTLDTMNTASFVPK